ncbi:MAG: ATP-binding protein [Gemmataceae bacterium]
MMPAVRHSSLLLPLCLGSALLLGSLHAVWWWLASRSLRHQKLEMEQDRARYNAMIVAAASDPIITFNYQGRIESFNDAASRLFGYTPEEVIGQDVTMLIQSTANVHLDSYVRREVPTGPGFVLSGGTHFRARTRSGQLIPVELGVTKVVDEDRHLYIQIIRDLTERERTERYCRLHSEVASLLGTDEEMSSVGPQVLAAVGECLHWPVGVLWMVDASSRVLRYGAGWCMQGCESSYLLHARRNPLHQNVGLAGQAWQRSCVQHREALTGDTPLPLSDYLKNGLAWPIRLGDEILGVLEFRAPSIPVPDAQLLQCLLPIATHLAQYLKRGLDQAALKRAKEVAEHASRTKSELLTNVSHEIRTPLNGILGLSELLRKEVDPGKQLEHVDLIRSSSQTLLGLVGDLLDLGRIEADRMTLDRECFNLRATLEPTLRTQAIRAEQKGLTFNWLIHADVPEYLVGDPLRLQQILLNLVGNAIKFTPEGEVQVRLAVSARTRREVILHGVVSDTGIGIPLEKQDRIFEAFYQDASSGSEMQTGTGLGLTITSRLVSLMGGRIWVQSNPGRGSSFHFTICLSLPAEDVDASNLPAFSSSDSGLRTPPPGTPMNRRLLVAEDNPVNRVLLEMILQKRNHQVTVVGSGFEVIEQCEKKPFDLVLMDVQLPQVDGIEATRRILARASDGHPAPVIVALTAHSGDEIRQRCLDAGMRACLSKPIQPAELLRMVDRFLRDETSKKEATPPPQALPG